MSEKARETPDDKFLMLCVLCEPLTLACALIQLEESAMMGKEYSTQEQERDRRPRNRSKMAGELYACILVNGTPVPTFKCLTVGTQRRPYSDSTSGQLCCSHCRWVFQHEENLCLDDRLYIPRAVCDVPAWLPKPIPRLLC